MFPNTTQVPNNLFNGELQKMKDTELRIILIVTRKTLGWIENPDTGMRKEEDWISHQQLIKLTGRSSRALSSAIENCIQNEWIEARDEHGHILDTKKKRIGKKIYYRLGKTFLSKIDEKLTLAKSKEVEAKDSEITTTSAKSSIEKSSIEKSAGYKRNPITKETYLQNNSMPPVKEDILKKEIEILKDKCRYQAEKLKSLGADNQTWKVLFKLALQGITENDVALATEQTQEKIRQGKIKEKPIKYLIGILKTKKESEVK